MLCVLEGCVAEFDFAKERLMTMVRDVEIGFQGAGRKLETVRTTIPAEWVSGENDAMSEVEDNPKVRTRIAIALGSALWAKISEAYDDSQPSYVTMRGVR